MKRSEIHIWAAAGGATAGALPVGLDSTALVAEEIAMIIRIGSHFGRNLTRNMAEGILSSQLATVIGSTAYVASLAAFEAANVGYPFTIPAKIGIAAGIIELIGNAAYSYYEKEAHA